MEKIKKLNILTGIILAGFLIAVIYHSINAFIFHLGFPYDRFIGADRWKFIDFISFYRLFYDSAFNPYVQTFFPGINYFPFGELIPYLFTRLPLYFSLFLFLSIGIWFFAFFNSINIKKIIPKTKPFNMIVCFITLSFLTHPFIFAVYSANQDLLVFIFLALFSIYFAKEKYLTSALFLAVAIAMKGYPLLFLALFLSRKKFKEVFYSLFLVFLLTFISLLLTKHGILENIKYYLAHMTIYKNMFIYTTWGIHSVSLFGTIKVLIMLIKGGIHSYIIPAHNLFDIAYRSYYWIGTGLYDGCNILNTKHFALMVYKIFYVFSLISTSLFALYTMFFEKELWKQAAILFICTLIFIPTTGPYKLINLFIPFWFFINSNKQTKLDLFYLICFGFVLIPKYYFFIVEQNNDNYIVQTMVTDPLVLLLMITVIVVEGLFLYKKNKSIKNLD